MYLLIHQESTPTSTPNANINVPCNPQVIRMNLGFLSLVKTAIEIVTIAWKDLDASNLHYIYISKDTGKDSP